ncbi:hypothetical protein, partial [Brucella anthropi]|uniref:hypothetical protein n=1 Tax=Brucella anthropi TaxID=529 RepID=UPI00235F435E
GVGVYRIFDYTGDLTANTMTIGRTANGNLLDYTLQTSIDHQVNLVSTAGSDFFFWNGQTTAANGTINGGSGTWDSSTTNWTVVNGQLGMSWRDDTFAVFGGAAGDVKI